MDFYGLKIWLKINSKKGKKNIKLLKFGTTSFMLINLLQTK